VTPIELTTKARQIRLKILEIIHQSKSSHIGSCFSIADILTWLYFGVMNVTPENFQDDNRDIFILSKGHAAAALYATLSVRGFFPGDKLDNYCQNGTSLSGHVIKDCLPGIEVSAGSLGHGLPIAAGMALAAKMNNSQRRVYCLVGDGESNEGSNWEAAMFAAHHKLDNLIVVVDVNNQQGMGDTSNVININSMEKIWQSFGWKEIGVDGHDFSKLGAISESLYEKNGIPKVVVANTTKGKGVTWMENNIDWHYKSTSDDQYNAAMLELNS